jgi:hypothetical protein
MLIKKIACVVSPPKMSIHWAEPWPMVRQHRQAKEKLKTAKKYLYSGQEFYSEEDICGFGNQPIIHNVRRTSGAMGMEKAVMDALTAIQVWQDDCQVYGGNTEKYWSPGNSGAQIWIETEE